MAMTITYLGNIKGVQGDQGDQGIQGLPGVNAVANDDAMATLIEGPSATKTALDVVTAPIEGEMGTAVKRGPGRLMGFLGDSFTLGNGASIQADHRFATLVPKLAGTRYTALNPVVSGGGGNTTADLLARMDADILGNAAVDHIHVQIGTNDADSLTPDQFATNVKLIRAKIVATGRTMSIGLVPPRTSAAGSPTRRRSETAFNEWLQQWAPRVGVILADTRTPLINPTDGYLNAAYSADGVHVNDDGHLLIAKAIADAYRAAMPTLPGTRVVNFEVNQLSNGIMSGGNATTAPTGWFKHADTSSGTAPVIGTVADSSGTLKEGVWLEVDLNADAASVAVVLSAAISAAGVYTAGDRMALECQMQVEDVAGFHAAAIAGTATVSMQMADAAVTTFGGVPHRYTAEFPVGPIRMEFVAPSSASISVRLRVNAPTGVRVKVRMGEVVVRNLTLEKAVAIAN